MTPRSGGLRFRQLRGSFLVPVHVTVGLAKIAMSEGENRREFQRGLKRCNCFPIVPLQHPTNTKEGVRQGAERIERRGLLKLDEGFI